jgi:hypothetical protein
MFFLRLMLDTGHFPAAIRTSFACHDALIHTADLIAIHRTCIADLGADLAKMMRELRTAELEVGRHLADFGTIHHQTEVLCLDMFSAHIKTVIHRGLQTDLRTMGTSFYTRLHGSILHGLLLHSAFMHRTFWHRLLSFHGVLLSYITMWLKMKKSSRSGIKLQSEAESH